MNSTWPLNRVLVLLVGGGCLLLMTDVRFEHMDVLREEHRAFGWVPVIYAGFAAVVSALAAARWTPRTRAVLFWVYALGLVVGGMGVWFHSGGHLGANVSRLAAVWFQKLEREHEPPQLAPLAFLGVALLGMLSCARRFQPAGTSAAGAAS